MKNIKEKGKTFKGKGKIFRQQRRRCAGIVPPLPLMVLRRKWFFWPQKVILSPKLRLSYIKIIIFAVGTLRKASNLIHIIYYMGLSTSDNNQQEIYFLQK